MLVFLINLIHFMIMENENKIEEQKIEEKSEKKEVRENKETQAVDYGEKMKTIWSKNKKIIIGIMVLAILTAGTLAFKEYWKKVDVGSEIIKSKIETFIKNNTPPGTKTDIKEIIKEGDLYKVALNIQGQDIPLYVTRDGKKLIQQPVDLDQKPEAEPEEAVVPKTDKPQVDLYLMSFCPYGNKAENTIKPVYDLLKDKVDFNFHYIVTVNGSSVQSLHGEKEVTQNEREACVLRDYGKDKWLAFAIYVNDKCGSDGSCWEAGAKSLGLSTAKITACVAKDGLALMTENGAAATAAKANGSPTLMINGVSSTAAYQYGKPEMYKQAICNAFNTAPAECAKTLPDQADTTAQGGSCN
jgi:hypothetical protein